MDLGDPGKWRKSKVDSFIRRHLNVLDLGMTRYYEMCMWDNKGTLVPSYALLMDKSIVLTENPPKSIAHTIPLSRIKDIGLIADRHSLIKGKNNNSYVCQHVAIVYEPSKNMNNSNNNNNNNNNKKAFSSTTDQSNSNKESLLYTDDDHSTNPPPPPSVNLSDEDRYSNSTNQSHTDLSVANCQYSDISVSPVPSSVALERSVFPQSFLNAYEPTIKVSRPSTGSSTITNISSSQQQSFNNNYNAWIRSSAKNGDSGRHHHRHHISHYSKEQKTSNILINKNNDPSASNSTLSLSHSPEKRKNNHDRVTPWPDWMSMTGQEKKEEIKMRKSRLTVTPEGNNDEEIKESGEGNGTSSSYQDSAEEPELHQIIDDNRRTHWWSRKGKGSSSKRNGRNRPETAPLPTKDNDDDDDDDDDDDANNNKRNKENVSSSKENEKKKGKSKKKNGASKTLAVKKAENMELYFYQRDSEFVNELSLVWNRQQLKNTEEQEVSTFGGLSKSLWVNKSLRAAEKIVSRVAQDWHIMEEEDDAEEPISLSFDNHYHHYYNNRSTKSFDYENVLRKVAFLHKCLMRYEHLKYLCWKNTIIMSGLVNTMMACLEPFETDNRDMRSLDVQGVYWDRVATYAILMDIFRTLFEACSVSWFKDTEFIYRNSMEFYDDDSYHSEWEADIWDQKLTIFDVTRKLLSSILKCPFLPRSCHIPGDHSYGCFVTITDPQKFIKATWLAFDDESSAKMAKMICTAHNASVALLFELLAIAHFLPTFIEKTLVTCSVRQMNLERYVRLSVTQIINILWNNRDPINSAQTMILYRQVWNLRNLLKHDHKILEFIRHNFSEEFHYYVTTKGIRTRIPDQYTIKPKVIDACEKLLEDILGKSGRHS